MTQEQINRKRERDREAKRRKRAAAREAISKPTEPVEAIMEQIAEAPKEPFLIPEAERALETAPKADPTFRIPLDCFEVHRRRLERERRA